MLSKDMNNQENQKKQNGSRRYSVLLLALLFIGMATYGTYAYFTDSTSVNGNIKLSTGTVKFAEVEKVSWMYKGNENGKIISTGVGEFDFQNVQPGDSFIKTVQVEYTGTLDGIVTVKQFTEKENENIEGVDYNIVINTPNADDKVFPGDDFTVILTATLPIGDVESHSANEENRNNKVDKVIDLNVLEEAVEISVVQLGVPR